jgi:hypothetical protein
VPVYDAANDRFEPGAGGGGGSGVDTLVGGQGEMIVGGPTGPPWPSTLFPGSDGDVLTMDSGDPQWLPPSGGGGAIPISTINAKGDLVVGDANDSVLRLAVGSNGQVLTADSAQTVGIKWATPTGTGGGGTPVEDLITAPGDLIVGDASSAPATFPSAAGTTINGFFLATNPSTPTTLEWQPPSSYVVMNGSGGTTRTLALADIGSFLGMTNTSTCTITVPNNSSVPLAVGAYLEGAQLGTGQLVFVGASGVTVNAVPGLKTASQYSTFGLLKTATNVWLLFGRLSA